MKLELNFLAVKASFLENHSDIANQKVCMNLLRVI